MKTFRALMLILALSVSAFAGDMDNGRVGDMPNGKAGWMETGKTGIMPNDFVATTTLQILQSVLPLF